MASRNIVIIGAGIGGLTAAVQLAQAGCAVTVCEAAATPGGKLRQVKPANVPIDAGPTVFTLKPIFDAIFADIGCKLEDHLNLTPLDCLARHAWDDGAQLDLFDDPKRTETAITAFAGAKAVQDYQRFRERSARIFTALDTSFMQCPQPGLLGLIRNAGLAQLPALSNLGAFATMWDELGRYFSNPKLQQLFARYATYCGASPFTAPATLMLIAHAEQSGVWSIAGGMFKLAEVLTKLAEARGAVFHFNSPVHEITTQSGHVCGVKLRDGQCMSADAVIANTDLAALDAGYFGEPAQRAVQGFNKDTKRSLSALTWAVSGRSTGIELAHHNVFFSSNYRAEFQAIAAGQMPADPTIYLCAPSKNEFFCLINAPANGDDYQLTPAEEDQCLQRMMAKLQRSGLILQTSAITRTGPQQFNQMFPASGGSLYGRALTNWQDSFKRPGAKTKLPGLYLAGGSVHPGPGLPMAALSGRLAATQILQDLASTKQFVPAAMPGGISTPLATTTVKPSH